MGNYTITEEEKEQRISEMRKTLKPQKEGEVRSQVFHSVFFAGEERIPPRFHIRDKEITDIEIINKNRWTKFQFEHYSAPFIFYGDLYYDYKVGDRVDVEYCFGQTSKGLRFLCIYEIKLSTGKLKDH